MHIVGASSLSRALAALPYRQRKVFLPNVTAISGLSLNPSTKNPHKRLQKLLTIGLLSKGRNVIWHDVINNSLSRHHSNNYTACTPATLLDILRGFEDQIEAVIYCRRLFTPDLLQGLLQLSKETSILVIDAKKLASPRRRKTSEFRHDLAETHPSHPLEIRFLWTISNHRDNLQSLVKTKRGKKSKPFPRKR